jgi:hypothetical protein
MMAVGQAALAAAGVKKIDTCAFLTRIDIQEAVPIRLAERQRPLRPSGGDAK